jgi:hypothetical protein
MTTAIVEGVAKPMACYGIRILAAVEDEERFPGAKEALGMTGCWRDEGKGGSRAAALHKGGGMKPPLREHGVPTRKSGCRIAKTL